MKSTGMSEAEWEHLALDTLGELGWTPTQGPSIAPGTGERENWEDLHIPSRMLEAFRTLNPEVPIEYLRQALAEITSPKSTDAITENFRMHEYLTQGFRGISYIEDGQEVTPTIRLIGADPDTTDWLAVSQVRIVTREFTRRFDVVLYCNGMPVSIIELKKAASEHADVAAAHAQLRTYLHEFPLAFRFAVFDLASDGIHAKYGTPFTPLNHFSPWNVDDDGAVIKFGDLDTHGDSSTGLENALYGLYNQERFLQLTRSFTAFDEGADGLSKRIAKPHQYFAVTKAVANTIEAAESNGKAGVVWHTQGSGKSMEMELYANLVMRHHKMLNPTVVVITDRNELDNQLFAGFNRSRLLPERPRQIRRRAELRDELSNRTTGGIYFTTLQKFGRSQGEKDSGADHPTLSTRRNIVVIVDEAHRSHYDDLNGYARHLKDALPNATLIAFTGTPISFVDRNTREVFGDYIDIYDLSRAVEEGATVPVYFAPRLIKVERAGEITDDVLDDAADEAMVGLDDAERRRVENNVLLVNAVYGAPERLNALARDIVDHWEARRADMAKVLEMPGKALIVCATREICANLYAAISELRPAWHSDELGSGLIKVVYSSSPTDTGVVTAHRRRDSDNKLIKERLRQVDDELQIVIVKDMMLTGYDSPPLHTLYLDRPLKGALLMQTLARVNRTFRGKQDGLLVAYAPLADNLQKALAEYTDQDQEHKPIGKDVGEAVAAVQELLDSIRVTLGGYDWKAVQRAGGRKARLNAATGAVNYLRSPLTPGNQVPEGHETLGAQFRRQTSRLARAWSLCSRAANLAAVQPEVQFYEEVRIWMAKYDAEERVARGEPIPAEIERLLSSLIASSTVSGDILDIYEAAGMPKPTLGDLSGDFVARAQQARNQHLAIEAIRKMIAEGTAKSTRTNTIRARAFSERVTELMNSYTNQQLTSAEVIAALVELAKDVAAESERGKKFTPPLGDDELSLYDAVAENSSAVTELGTGVLADIARELVAILRRDVRTDWTVRDDVRAKLRSSIKRLLVKYKYPPDQQPAAIKQVMDQMESMAPRFAGRQPVDR